MIIVTALWMQKANCSWLEKKKKKDEKYFKAPKFIFCESASLEIVLDILIARNYWCSFQKWMFSFGHKINPLNYLSHTNLWWNCISWGTISLFLELVFPSIYWTKSSLHSGDKLHLAKQKWTSSPPFSLISIFHILCWERGKSHHQLTQFTK